MNESTTINSESTTPKSASVHLDSLELGDVIMIHAPRNANVDKQTYYVFYIDELKLKLLNVSTHQLLKLNIDGYVADESIESIDLLSRSDVVGFAKQHKLEPPQWIDVHFGGDMPTVISGEITNLEEDMIEITTYPGMRVIYVDFAYQGIPETLPIEKIVLRERPKAIQTSLRSMMDGYTEIGREEAEAEASAELDEEDGQLIVSIPENVAMNPSPAAIVEEYIDQEIEAPKTDEEEDDGELASLQMFVEVPESERRYSEEMQVADLLGELVSKIAPEKRTAHALKDIHKIVTRFKELRRIFSSFDVNGDVVKPKTTSVLHKPLVDHVAQLDKNVRWLIPVVSERNELLSFANDKEIDSYDGAPTHLETDMSTFVQALETAQKPFTRIEKTGSTATADQGGEANKYDRMLETMNELCAPADNTSLLSDNIDVDVYIQNKEVTADLECVVSNDDDFQMDSSVMKHGTFHETGKYRFTTRRYTTASSRMVMDETTRRKTYERKLVGKSDRANVRSIIMLPRQVLLQSHYKSPSANLYLKSKLAEIPVYKFQFLKARTRLAAREIEDIEKELAYENMIPKLTVATNAATNPNGEPFLKVPTQYFLPKNGKYPVNEKTFRGFLDAIIPRTRTLVRWMKPSIEHLYSLIDVVAALEPFAVESENITFKQWVEIRNYIKTKTNAYIVKIHKQKKELRAVKSLLKLVPKQTDRIRTILSEQNEFEQFLFNTYRLNKDAKEEDATEKAGFSETERPIKPAKSTSSSETLQNFIQLDGAEAYSAILNLYLVKHLTMPESMMELFKRPVINSDEPLKIATKSACDRRFIAKKYTSVAALRKDDNTKDVWYDKEYDDTPYRLLDKYKDEKKRFGGDDETFFDFLVETLIEKHDCPPSMAPELTRTMLSKKKRVSEGEYAMLEIKPTLVDKLREEDMPEHEKRAVEQEAETRKIVEFYRRSKDAWVLDKTVDLESFIDTNTLFCELSESCNKLTDVAQCVPGEMATMQMRLAKRARMLREFEDRVAQTFEDVAENLRVDVSRMRRKIWRNDAVRTSRLYRQNTYSYNLGKYAKSTETVVESPHVDLRDKILAWPDFVQKQNMIYQFAQEICRHPQLANEDEHWMYCKTTNTRLLPMSIFVLAAAFLFDNYQTTLDILLRDNGTLSDDGDAIVDKYTGYVLRHIDYSSEEGFDESGFRITTNAVIEEDQDVGATVMGILSTPARRYTNETARYVHAVFQTLCENMGIEKDLSSIEDFVLRVSTEILDNPESVMTEPAYAEYLAGKAAKKTSTKDGAVLSQMPYSTYYNQMIVILVSCATFAAMQTLIPPFKTKKTFPGCVKSFAGYPLDEGNAENVSGLRYIACVLDKSKRSSAQPWSSIEPLGLDAILKRLKTAMKTEVYSRADVANLYGIKRDYLLKYPDLDVPEEVGVQRWTHFLPPVVPFSFDSGRLPSGITMEYEKELFQTIMQGSAEQFKMIGLMKGKLLKHGYLVYDIIQRIVRSKQLLLSTAGGKAFLENACCNEDRSKTNPLHYFIQEVPELENVVKKARTMESAMLRVKWLSRARTFFDPTSSRIIGAAIPDAIISKTIYETFIHYCNFDTDSPIPAYLFPVATTKPEYNRFASLDEKIAFLKKHGKNYGVGDFYSLMRLVNGRNMVHRTADKDASLSASLSAWKDLLEYFDDRDSHLIESRLRGLLHHSPEDDPTNKTLTRYLRRANDKMREVIVQFLTLHGNLTNNQSIRLSLFLENSTQYSIGDAPSALKEIANSVYNMAKVYPNKTITNHFVSGSPKHWNFSPAHKQTLDSAAAAFYREIAALSDENPESVFNQYLKRAVIVLSDLAMFVEYIPTRSIYDDETVFLLHKYAFLSTIHEYIVLSNDREFVQMRAEEIRNTSMANPGGNDLEIGEDYGAATMVRQVHIVESDALELKKLAAKWLIATLGRERSTKEAIDYGYKEIMERTMGLKYKDKKIITDYLAGLSRDERRVEQDLRKYKIGRWNVGLQKGLFQYNKDIYEREVERWKEGDGIVYSVPSSGEQDVEDLERAAQEEQAADYDGGDGWDNLNEDYTDGVYYEEDAEQGDYDEY